MTYFYIMLTGLAFLFWAVSVQFRMSRNRGYINQQVDDARRLNKKIQTTERSLAECELLITTMKDLLVKAGLTEDVDLFAHKKDLRND